MLNKNKLEPQLRFPEFSGDWEEKRLGDVAKIYDGTHQTPKYVSEGVPFLSVENLKDFKAKKFISKEAYEKEFKVFPEYEDILMSKIGDVGTSNILLSKEKFAYYVSLALIKCDKNTINPHYLNQAIKSNHIQKEIYKNTLHIAFPKKINLGNIGECIINYPSLPEQTRIATFFTKLDEEIELIEEKINLLEQRKKGFMQKIFSQELRFKADDGSEFPEWEEKRLGDVCTIKTGNSDVQDAVKTGKYPFFDRGGVKYLNDYLFDNEAIIYAGEGSEFLPRYINGKYALHQRCYSLHDFNNGINVKFIYQQLGRMSNHFLKTAVGTTVPSLRLDSFKLCDILLPCISEQQKISSFLSTLDSELDMYRSKLSSLKERKQGLMQRMFV